MNHSPSIKHGTATLFFLLLLSPQILLPVGAQPNNDPQNEQYYTKFSPSMAVIIAVLIAALFLMGFFSIYIRRCSDAQANASVRPGGTHTGRSRRGARGLDPAVIETFPTLEYSVVRGLKIGKGALECAVCLNEFENDETLRLIPKCDHVFHPECIDAWLASHTTCPVCRSDLVPQPGDPAPQLPELTPQQPNDVEAQSESVHVVEQQQEVSEQPDLLNLNQALNRNRTRRSRSSKLRRLFPRSHSTGHSLFQPGDDTERFTLRLPVEVRKQIMNRELHRSTSMVVLPREGSSRRGPRTGGESGSGSYRVNNYRRLEKLDQQFKSDRWVFSMAPPFLTRMSSLRSSKVAANEGEGTSAQPVEPVL